jgi:hypothetical protein
MRRTIRRPEPLVGFVVGLVRPGIGVLERSALQRRARGGGQIREPARADRGQQCRAVGWTLLSVDGAHRNAKDLGL